ncbi:MAG: hypothetical protein R2798_01995 [Chitinophagales bacterium]|nr:hypothetical protein [Bacteroidota bacterium]MCB9042793.1 hypothetical protein [Chitinophagales bacterium]
MKYFFAFLFIALLSFSACKDEYTTPEIDTDWTYFPIEENYWIVYRIDTIQKHEGFSDTQSSWEVREEIGNSFTDNAGRTAHWLNRYLRPVGSSQAWEEIIPQQAYTVRTATTAERISENRRFLVLAFPFSEAKSWWGNTYIDEEFYAEGDQFSDECSNVYFDKNWRYTLSNINEPAQLASLSFDSTVTVIQNDYYDLRDRVYSKEIYAKNVGLVYKEIEDLSLLSFTLPSLEESPWPNRANCGSTIIWRVLDYKK